MYNQQTYGIIGGGYTGLSTAISLLDKENKVTLIEKSNFLGGLGESIQLSNKKYCEAYYHHFFLADKYLSEYCLRFISEKITYKNSSMAIFYKNSHNSWNGIFDLFQFPFINIIDKIRFIFATLLLSNNLISRKKLDAISLNDGLLSLYGEKVFESIWGPMVKGKFGETGNQIPLRWMSGRLKQRLESRKFGKEKLGYLKGSLRELTLAIGSYLQSNKKCNVLKNASIENIYYNKENKKYNLDIKKNNKNKKYEFDKIIFTTSSKTANKLLKSNSKRKTFWKEHKYFTAYCVLLELTESLSKFYWTNIADKDIFFCGYIEQTQLTGIEEYGGIHIAYLTKYDLVDNKNSYLEKNTIEELAYESLYKLFPDKDINGIVKKMHISISHNAQVVTDFNFKPNKIDFHKKNNLFITNMSNVYPDERSINNAIKLGKNISATSL